MDPSIAILLQENERLKKQLQEERAYIAELESSKADPSQILLLEENERLLNKHKEDQLTIDKLQTMIKLLHDLENEDDEDEEDASQGSSDAAESETNGARPKTVLLLDSSKRDSTPNPS